VRLKQLVETTLEKHIKWLEAKGMVVNRSKTTTMLMGKESMSVECGGNLLKDSESVKILGIHFDKEMTWSKQI